MGKRLAAEAAVVERRQNRVQIAGSLSLQLRQEFVDRRRADRKREDPLSPLQMRTYCWTLPCRWMPPLPAVPASSRLPRRHAPARPPKTKPGRRWSARRSLTSAEVLLFHAPRSWLSAAALAARAAAERVKPESTHPPSG